MKFWIKIILFLFIVFLSTPTIVSAIDEEVDISCFYNMTEEEENTINFNEIKSFPIVSDYLSDFLQTKTLQKIFRTNDELIESSYCVSILIPPPELL